MKTTKFDINIDENGEFVIRDTVFKIDVVKNLFNPGPMLQLYKSGTPCLAVTMNDLTCSSIKVTNSEEFKNVILDAIKDNWFYNIPINKIALDDAYFELLEAKWDRLTAPEKSLFSAPYNGTVFNRIKSATIGRLVCNDFRLITITNDICDELHHMENNMDSEDAYDRVTSDEFIEKFTNDKYLGTIIKTVLLRVC